MSMAERGPRITASDPRLEKLRKELGMSKARLRYLVKLADRVMDENDAKDARAAARKRAARNAARRKQRALLKESASSAKPRARR